MPESLCICWSIGWQTVSPDDSYLHSAKRGYNASADCLIMLLQRDKFFAPRRNSSALGIQFACQPCLGGGLIAAYGISVFETGG